MRLPQQASIRLLFNLSYIWSADSFPFYFVTKSVKSAKYIKTKVLFNHQSGVDAGKNKDKFINWKIHCEHF